MQRWRTALRARWRKTANNKLNGRIIAECLLDKNIFMAFFLWFQCASPDPLYTSQMIVRVGGPHAYSPLQLSVLQMPVFLAPASIWLVVASLRTLPSHLKVHKNRPIFLNEGAACIVITFDFLNCFFFTNFFAGVQPFLDIWAQSMLPRGEHGPCCSSPSHLKCHPN